MLGPVNIIGARCVVSEFASVCSWTLCVASLIFRAKRGADGNRSAEYASTKRDLF